MRRKRPSSRRAADKCNEFASPHRRPLKQRVLPYHAVGYIVHHGKFGLLMSASLIGRMRSSAFRLSTITVSRSLASTRFSSESAPGPSIMGSEDEVEQS